MVTRSGNVARSANLRVAPMASLKVSFLTFSGVARSSASFETSATIWSSFNPSKGSQPGRGPTRNCSDDMSENSTNSTI